MVFDKTEEKKKGNRKSDCSRPIHTKDDNYNHNHKDIVLKIRKEKQSPHLNYYYNGTVERYH